MRKVKNILKKYCKDKGFRLKQDKENSNIMHLPIFSTNFTYQGRAIIDEENTWFEFYSTISLPFRRNQQEILLELTNRVNWEVSIGNILLNVEEKFLAYCTSIPYQGIDNDGKIFDTIIDGNISVIDHNYPAYLLVSYGDRSAEEALKDLEEIYYEEEIEESKKQLPN